MRTCTGLAVNRYLADSAKTFLAVRRALTPASGTRNKTSMMADRFLDRTASLNNRSSRKKRFSGVIRRPGIPISLSTSVIISSHQTYFESQGRGGLVLLKEKGRENVTSD